MCAVGQLTLGWEAKSHRISTQELRKLLDLRDVELSWSPGHANIKGNELADQLAKEAAQEAKGAENLQAVSSFGDIIKSTNDTVILKWQSKWETIDRSRGRNLSKFRPNVGHELNHS